MKIKQTKPSPIRTPAITNAINIALSKKGLANIYAAMGSGKTYATKKAVEQHNQVLVVSPYRVARKGFAEVGFEYIRNPDNLLAEIHKGFVYVNTLLSTITHYCKEHSMAVEYSIELVAFILSEANPDLKIIIDEADAVELQTRMHTYSVTDVEGRKLSQTNWFNEYALLIEELSKYFPIVQLSATTMSIRPLISEVVEEGTTARINTITNFLMPQTSKEDITDFIKTRINKGQKTLVFANKFDSSIYSLLNTLDKACLVTRKELLATVNESGLPEFAHNRYSVEAKTHLVEDVVPLELLFLQYDVVFVTQSLSRVVSINSQYHSFKVITIGDLEAANVQVTLRPRQTPVDVENIIVGKLKKDLKEYEGMTYYTKLKAISPCSDEYQIQDISSVWVNTRKVVGSSSAIKQAGFNDWFSKFYNQNESVRSNHRQYKLVHPDGYGLEAFQRNIKENI